ncbi:MAG: hypothetical protein COB54_02205 [Alphaproteobacteria bacterium]|nr:MAG: hypothetical protein COB54_02205 [Alphaproteobacteria bacterium]
MRDCEITGLKSSEFTSDYQRDLLTYWLKMKGDYLMPSRNDLDPSEIPRLLPCIWMADVMGSAEPTFKVRLFGTDLVRAFQREGTSLELDTVSFAGDIIKRLTNLVVTKKPYYLLCEFPIPSDDFKFYSTLSLPMSSDDKTVDIILSYVHCFR